LKGKSQYPEKLNQPDFIARLQLGDETAYRELDNEFFYEIYCLRGKGIWHKP
jgi:hypothetical protein